MDTERIATFTRTLTRVPSRRDVLRGLAATGLGLGIAQLPLLVAAKRRPTMEAEPKAARCLKVGERCRRASQCCSSICKRRSETGQKKCRAHGTGICKQGVRGACAAKSADDLLALACHGTKCFCFRTAAGSNFCSAGPYTDGSSCAACQTDADCEALGFPSGSACAPVSGGICGVCASGTACLARCDYD